MSLFETDKSASRIPVSVITGFLGSGKTTLLNRLLRHPDMSDSAVIINEWGEVGIDHLLVETVEGEVAVLASGCVCCTLRSDLETTIRGLLVRRDNGEVPPFRRVLLETTGLADPAPIMQMLLNNPLLSHFARLDAVVTTVDVVNAPRQLDAHQEAVKQVAVADRLLLTKTDLADAAAVFAVESQLSRLNRGAAIIVVAHGEVPPDRLFGAALFDPARKTPDVEAWLRPERHEHHGDEHVENDSGIRSFCLTFDDPLQWQAVSGWLMMLRQWRGEDLLRVKGILHLQEEELPVAIHGVHHVFHPPVQLSAWPEDDRRSRIVFITRGLERAEVEGAWSMAQPEFPVAG
ncbi:MAG TPA: GTP-binding protein [Stellaceae bacterium]